MIRPMPKTGKLLSLLLVAATSCAPGPIQWRWSYSGKGISALGTFTTPPTPDPGGAYRILGITGSRNGESIVRLHPAGFAIPGNEPYKLDNLIANHAGKQLSGNGFGYSTASGSYATAFFHEKLGYLEVFSAPPLIEGAKNLGKEDSELPISFVATPASGSP